MKWYSFVPENLEKCIIIYDRKCPPNNSVYEEWTTVGLENDGAQITFIEYDFYYKDPDGVREAYDCVYDSIYNITVDTSKADKQKLFALTITKDSSIIEGFDIDIKQSKVIYIFTEPYNFDNNLLLRISNQIENDSQNAKEIIEQNLLVNKNFSCLVILNDRM